MSLVSNIKSTVLQGQFVSVKNLQVNNTITIPLVAPEYYVTDLNIGNTVSIAEVGVTLAISSDVSLSNCSVTGIISTNNTPVFSGLITIPDSLGPEHKLNFTNGYLTYASQGTYTQFLVETNVLSPGSSADNQFRLPLVPEGTYNMTVLWGDGGITIFDGYDASKLTHTYPAVGQYQIYIYGTCEGWVFNNTGDRLKLFDVSSVTSTFKLGTTQGGYFYGCSNLSFTAPTAVNLTGTTNLDYTFAECLNLYGSASISSWTTSLVTSMVNMFKQTPFNQSLSLWNTMNVLSMEGMFQSSYFNNGQITTLPSVLPFSSYYTNSTKRLTCPGAQFVTLGTLVAGDVIWILRTSGEIKWYINVVQSVLDDENVVLVTAFGLNITLGQISNIQKPSVGTLALTWNVSSCTNMSSMFEDAIFFNQNVNTFNTAPLQSVENMFYNAYSYNNGATIEAGGVPLTLDVANVNNMASMFTNTIAFNQSLVSWAANVANVTSMASMFGGSRFNNGQVTTLTSVIPLLASFVNSTKVLNCPGASLTSNVTAGDTLWILRTGGTLSWYVSTVQSVTNNENLVLTTAFGVNITVGQISNIQKPTAGTASLSWVPSNCVDVSNMFEGALFFNQNINTFNAAPLQSVASMFSAAFSFNNGSTVSTSGTLTLNTAGVADLNNMFKTALAFNQNVSGFNVSNVTVMENLFFRAKYFNQNLTNWDVSNVQTMYQIFRETSFNNGDVAGGSSIPFNWKIDNLENMSYMFQSTPFNQDINYDADNGYWNTSKVTNMFQTFYNATMFNRPIGLWDVSSVTTMHQMFLGASIFNQPLGDWDVSNVTTMFGMFTQAPMFNQNLTDWDVSKVTDFSNMFLGSTTLSISPRFNNGETGLANIPNVVAANCVYTNGTKQLSCTGATFNTSLDLNDVIVIQSATVVYSSKISDILGPTLLVLETAYGASLPGITSVQKQVAGTAPLSWTLLSDPSKEVSLSAMFRYNRFFNQNIGGWDTSRVTTVENMFGGVATSGITLFNNGQIITGTTAKMGNPTGWTFAGTVNSTGYRTNCRLQVANKPNSLP